MLDIHQSVHEHKDLIIQMRRDLHRIPEIGYGEKKTSAYVVEQLTKQGLAVHPGIATIGSVGVMDTGKPGPTLMIRADMDALPIAEATGLPFASTHEGMMHACGHDGHMAMVLGAVPVLKKLKQQLTGQIKFLFQPAEEGPGGAKPMIEKGVMENPHVDYTIGCHIWPEIPEGTIGVRAGPFMAAMDRFDIKIIGKGGHGAMPHACVDTLEVGTQVVNALQRIVSRQMNPLEPAVVTIGSFHAGTAFNVIPMTAELSGTTRTFNTEVWNSWEARLHKILYGVCSSMGADFELNYTKGYPVLINDPSISEVVRQCAAQAVGDDRMVIPEKSMGGEDFSYYLQKSEGCFFALGAGKEGGVSVHHPMFDFNEDILLLGVETYCRTALALLG